MKAGVSTYAYFWRRPPLPDMLEDVARMGGEVLQICDWPPLEASTESERRALSRQAASLGITLELGTRASTTREVGRYLRYCEAMDARLLRVLPAESLASVESVRELLPMCEAAGVTLALETYESMTSHDLLALVTEVDHPHLGVCLDPTNCLAALEPPERVMTRLGRYTVNVHVKDFVFRRRDDRIGFVLIGCPLGEGLLDLSALLGAVRGSRVDCSAIVELWLPESGADTREVEARWTETSLRELQRRLPRFRAQSASSGEPPLS